MRFSIFTETSEVSRALARPAGFNLGREGSSDWYVIDVTM